MANLRPFTNVDPATAAALRRHGCDPHELDLFMEHKLAYIYALVPRPPFPDNGRLAALATSSDGADRISRLPDELLRNVVARLPAKDGARTAVLSSCWRALWRSTPLVLSDAHLLPDGHGWPPTPADSPAVIAAVSRILEAHPRPFRSVDLVCSHMNAYRAQLARWIQLLAAKGVQDVVLVNRPWPQDVPLPAALFSSKRCDQPTGNHLTCKFWEESGPIESVVSRIHTMCLREFRGDPGEVGFLEFFRTARALRAAVIVLANPRFTPFSKDEAVAKVRDSCGNMASESSYQFVVMNQGPAGGAPWNFKTGADFSFPDPFSFAAGVFQA